VNNVSVRPLSVNIKALAAKNGNLLPKDEMRVLINIIKMAKEEEMWKEFCFATYLKSSLDSKPGDESVIEDFKARGWLADPLEEGKYLVTGELFSFLEPFIIS
jgi:hypothetical protein